MRYNLHYIQNRQNQIMALEVRIVVTFGEQGKVMFGKEHWGAGRNRVRSNVLSWLECRLYKDLLYENSLSCIIILCALSSMCYTSVKTHLNYKGIGTYTLPLLSHLDSNHSLQCLEHYSTIFFLSQSETSLKSSYRMYLCKFSLANTIVWHGSHLVKSWELNLPGKVMLALFNY